MTIERIARHLFDANQARLPFEWLTGDLLPKDLTAAYAVQSALIDLWESEGVGRVAGWKIALTSTAMQELLGVDQPCVGAVLGPNIQSSPAAINMGDFVRLGLEFELAVRMAADTEDQVYDASTIRPLVAGVAPAFELIEDRGADYTDAEAMSLVADNTWNGGVILGEEIANWQAIDWRTQPVTLTYNGVVETAVTGDAMGDPFAALAFVANNLRSRGKRLSAWDIVITGSTLKTRFAEAGDRAQYEINGLGAVELIVSV
jgi:2-keto-4-pentenoate hydratase